MASTIKSSKTTSTKKVAGKTIKTVVDETTVSATSEVISLDKQKKKAETLIAELVRLREAITDLEKEKTEATEAIYALMGWEKVLIGDTEKWVGVATKGTINGGTRITIGQRSRTDVNKKLLEADFPEVFAKTKVETTYTVVSTKQTIPSRHEPSCESKGVFAFSPIYIRRGKNKRLALTMKSQTGLVEQSCWQGANGQGKGNQMKDVWTSSVTAEMTKGMTANEIEILIADLDDAVMLVCQDYGIEG